MDILTRLESKINGYYEKTLNLNEFINYYRLDMILNNDLISNPNLYFELYNYDELYNNEFEDLDLDYYQEDILEILESEDLDPEEYQEIIKALNNNDKEELSLLNEAVSDFISDKVSENIYSYECYQYFIIPYQDIEYWEKYTNYPIYEEEEQDLYLIGITHFGMSWDYFQTTATKTIYL